MVFKAPRAIDSYDSAKKPKPAEAELVTIQTSKKQRASNFRLDIIIFDTYLLY